MIPQPPQNCSMPCEGMTRHRAESPSARIADSPEEGKQKAERNNPPGSFYAIYATVFSFVGVCLAKPAKPLASTDFGLFNLPKWTIFRKLSLLLA